MASTTRHCRICGARLNPVEAGRGLLCTGPLCQRSARSPSGASACVVCGKGIAAFRQRPDLSCGGFECVSSRQVEASAARQQAEVVAREATAVHIHAELGFREDVFPVAVPSNPRPVVEASVERADAMRLHISALIDTALADPSPADRREGDISPKPTWMAALCGACRGACCLSGNENRAFLTVDTIKRVREERGGVDRDALLYEYTSRIPEVAYEEGCVFQGAMGCTLPREIRSDTCNGYYCKSFKRAQQRFGPSGATEALAVAYAHGKTTPAAVVRVGPRGLDPVRETRG